MFWKKKEATAVPVSTGKVGAAPAGVPEAVPAAPKAARTKVEKLAGPKLMPGLLEKQLVSQYKVSPELARLLQVVVHRRGPAGRAFECRIFDMSEAEASGLAVKDYTSLDGHQDMVLYEGWYDEDSKQVELAEKKKVDYNVPILTEAEIQKKVETLQEPGSTVFFYQARGPALGGPLGRGAAIVELNPDYPKKGKKYTIYTAGVVGREPAGNRQKLMGVDKPKEIAKWIKDAHVKRIY